MAPGICISVVAFFTSSMFSEIINHPAQQLVIFSRPTNCDVAFVTEERANLAGLMVMIHGQIICPDGTIFHDS
jgi:hypothetical protein